MKHQTSTRQTVAICIGTYNQAQYLANSIASAIHQTHPIEEIIVADDCSTDDTESVMEKLCREHPQVRYHRHPQNLGLSGNLSWVLSKPKSDLVVRLDSDDQLDPDYVSLLAKLMREYPEAAFAHCDVNEIGADGSKIRIRQLGPRSAFESSESFLKRSSSGFRVAANCILYRARALREADYYYPNLTWRFSEDWDLCLRMAARGWGNVYCPRNLANYRVWNDSHQVRAKRKIAEVETTIQIYKNTLEPEYLRRGWKTDGLRREMQKKALGFVDAVDSPVFSAEERQHYLQLLKVLGGSKQLSIAISLAERGLNPALRGLTAIRVNIRNKAKTLVKAVGQPLLRRM